MLAGLGHAIIAHIAVHGMIEIKRMINAVQMDRVGQIVRVVQDYLDLVTLFDTNDGCRQPQHRIGLDIDKAFSGHPARLRRKDPEPWLDAGSNRITRHRIGHIRRAAVELHDLEPDMHLVRIAIAIQIIPHNYSIWGEVGMHHRLHGYVVGTLDKGCHLIRIIRTTDRRFLYGYALDDLFFTPLGTPLRTEGFGLTEIDLLTCRRRLILGLCMNQTG